MSPPAGLPGFVRFGLFELDLSAGQLRKQNRTIKLQDQPFHVLLLLVSRPGDIVSREDIQRALWPAHTFVEFDQGLNTAIKKIRVALGDSADNPRFIETIPRKGYRFIAPLAQSPSPVLSNIAPISLDLSTDQKPFQSPPVEVAARPHSRRAVTVWLSAAATGLLLCIAGLIV